MRHPFAASLAALVAACPLLATAARAVPITYTETTTGSGTLDGAGFTNGLVTVVFVGDTSGVVSFAPGVLVNPTGVVTVAVAGLGAATFTAGSGTAAVDDRTASGAGIGAQAFNPPSGQPGPPLVLAVTAPPFATYDLASAVGPATGAALFEPGLAFSTDGGAFVLTAAGDVTFTATINAVTVPEPMSIALLGTGLLGFGFTRRR